MRSFVDMVALYFRVQSSLLTSCLLDRQWEKQKQLK